MLRIRFVLILSLAGAAGIANAQPGVNVDVRVDVAVDDLAPPGTVATAPQPRCIEPRSIEPRRWFSLGGMRGVASRDQTPATGIEHSYSGRLEADLLAFGPYRVGVAFAKGSDDRFTVDGSFYQGVQLSDTRAVIYAARAARRGRFEVRGAVGGGIVMTRTLTWDGDVYLDSGGLSGPAGSDAMRGAMVAPICEGSFTVSVDLFSNLALGFGPLVTLYHQTFPNPYAYPNGSLDRGTDLELQLSLRASI